MEFMKQTRDRWLQWIGDYIIMKVTLCEPKDAWLWLNIGIWLDEFCIENFDLYLE